MKLRDLEWGLIHLVSLLTSIVSVHSMSEALSATWSDQFVELLVTKCDLLQSNDVCVQFV